MPQPVINDGSLIFRFLLKYQCENRVFLHLFSGRAKYSSSVKSSWNCQHRTQLWEPFLQTEPLRERQSSLQNGRFTLPMSLYRMCVFFFFFNMYNVYIWCKWFVYIYLYCINTQAVNLLGNRETLSDVEREKVNTALLPLYLNLSFTELRLDRPHKALKYGNKALEIDSDSTKALFRCGQVRRDSLW